MKIFAAIAALSTGCLSFSGAENLGPTADASTDGSGGDASDECQSWVPEHVACSLAPGNALMIDADASYDTDTGSFNDSFADPPSDVRAQSSGDSLRVIEVTQMSVESGATLRVVGSMPLVIIARGSIEIAGTLDVSSTLGDLGAGANSSLCGASSGGSGVDGSGGAGGAGGGGFTIDGANGGDGDLNGNINPGGAGGVKVVTPTLIRGGCSGGRGGVSDGAVNALGGAGGGAIELVALTEITISGVVHAGGAGGEAAEINERGGGGGGGSGGYIGLDSPSVIVSGTVAANGGGGGGGADLASGVTADGDNGTANALVANGGDSGLIGGGAGGDGGAIDDNSTLGQDANGGGGGGGGSVGAILVWTATASVTGIQSPAAIITIR